MRRMNSMLLGHQGASARTDCMYFCDRQHGVAGSSHDSGRCTMRVGTSMSSIGGRLRLELPQARRAGARRDRTPAVDSGPAASGCRA